MPNPHQETAEALTELIRKGLVKIIIAEDGELKFSLVASKVTRIEDPKAEEKDHEQS